MPQDLAGGQVFCFASALGKDVVGQHADCLRQEADPGCGLPVLNACSLELLIQVEAVG
ncbi:MAG: hypothetical protein ACRD2E_02790 [Terriglobales bacterium]